MYPVTFYPTCLSRISQEELAGLDKGLFQALQKKLNVKCREPWARLKKRLNDLFKNGTDRRKVVDFLVEIVEQAEDDAMKDLLF